MKSLVSGWITYPFSLQILTSSSSGIQSYAEWLSFSIQYSILNAFHSDSPGFWEMVPRVYDPQIMCTLGWISPLSWHFAPLASFRFSKRHMNRFWTDDFGQERYIHRFSIYRSFLFLYSPDGFTGSLGQTDKST